MNHDAHSAHAAGNGEGASGAPAPSPAPGAVPPPPPPPPHGAAPQYIYVMPGGPPPPPFPPWFGAPFGRPPYPPPHPYAAHPHWAAHAPHAHHVPPAAPHGWPHGRVVDAEFADGDAPFSRTRRTPPEDEREYPLGFYEPNIPGRSVIPRAQAEQLAAEVTADLVTSMTTGKAFDFAHLAWKIVGRGVGAVDVVSRPQMVFRGKRLVLGERAAKYFSVVDIKVGNRSQLSHSTAIPGSSFVANVEPLKLYLDVAVVAQDITVVVENLSRRPRTFEAVMYGAAAT